MADLIPLSYWQAFLAVVDCNGYARAAEALAKSQSSVSYAVQRLEEQLGVRVFRLEGRRAVPTRAGEALLQRARRLVEQAQGLEASGRQLASGVQPPLHVAIDALFPGWLMLQALAQLSDSGHTPLRVELMETVLSGTDEALLRREADLAITPRIPQGFSGEALMQMRFVAVAAPGHPLHRLGRTLDWSDLREHRQLVLRDSGSRRDDAGWLDAEQRWTFSHISSSIAAACAGQGFAWFPELCIRDELAQRHLIALPLQQGLHRYAMLYRVFARPDHPARACQRLAEILDALTEPLDTSARRAR